MKELVIDKENYHKTKNINSKINLEDLIKEKKILLVENYNNIDKNKYIKIIVDKVIENPFKTEFASFFKKGAITEIEDKYFKEKKCINELSLFDKLEDYVIKKDGLIFNCKILKKGTVVYKATKGFVYPEDETNITKTVDKNILVYFSDIYYPYNIIRNNFFGLNSYLIKKDLILFDRCSLNKESSLYKLIEDENDEEINNVVNTINNVSYTLDVFYKKYYELWTTSFNARWDSIYIYTHISKDVKGIFCYNRNNSTNMINNKQDLQQKLFDFLLKFIKIDGFANCTHFSSNSLNGYFPEDEICLTNSILLNRYIVRNTEDPLDWINWKLKNIKLPSESIYLTKKLVILISRDVWPLNNNFSIFKYVNESKNKYKKIKKNNMFLTYNVHFFEKYNYYQKNEPNINITNFINNYYDNLDICVIQEYKKNDYFYKNVNFKYKILTPNGSKNDNLNLCVLSKEKLKFNIIKHIDFEGKHRNSILIFYNNLKIACVHITIALKHVITVAKSKNLKDIFNQLKGIIKYNPDYIIGDFNFSPEDKDEINFMKANNYFLLTEPKYNTTPYNKVDLVFRKKYKQPDDFCDMVLTDYSDHRPVFYKLI